MATTAATFCATLVDEWVRGGVTCAFVAPGSRSTPLALALAADDRISVTVAHDERTASFAALGFGRATGRPAVTLCTSGTAAANFHASVIEADLSRVPLIVCTADRPPELWDIGAPQTVNQSSLYGRAVRFYAEPGVPSVRTASAWRSIGSRLVVEAVAGSGPVHANLSFVDPLVGDPDPLPPGRPDGQPWHRVSPNPPSVSAQLADEVFDLLVDGAALDGVVIAGRGTPEPEAVLALATALGWPVLADHRSGCRVPGGALRHFDALLRADHHATRLAPEVVVRFGEPLASKSTSQWLSRHRPSMVVASDSGGWSDPERLATLSVPAHGLASALAERAAEVEPSDWVTRWHDLDTACADVVAALVDIDTEPGVLRAVLAGVPDGSALLVSSSMPVRDLEWYGDNRAGVEVLANRGANGIDGVVATAVGVATSGRPTTVVVGDVAFIHDSSTLAALAARPIDLTIVVIDNDGGGIFSFLPQATDLDPDRFEQLFGTPHGTDVAALARAHGITVDTWPTTDLKPDGVRVIVATTDREANRVLHDQIHHAITALA